MNTQHWSRSCTRRAMERLTPVRSPVGRRGSSGGAAASAVTNGKRPPPTARSGSAAAPRARSSAAQRPGVGSHGIARSRPIARISLPSFIPIETRTSTLGAWRCIPRGAYGGCARRAGTNGRPGPLTASGAPLAAPDVGHCDAPASRGRSRRSAPSRHATRLSQQSSTLSAIPRSTLRGSVHDLTRNSGGAARPVSTRGAPGSLIAAPGPAAPRAATASRRLHDFSGAPKPSESA